MLVIRMQRTGRKGHAMFRVIVQDSRLTPTSGKIVAQLGHYDPHAKVVTLDKDKASFYLEHGAQPSDRTARLLKAEGVKLPAWVKLPADKKREVRSPEKRRSTAPAEPEATAEEAPSEDTAEAPSEPSNQEAAVESEATPAPEAESPAEQAAEAAPAESDEAV